MRTELYGAAPKALSDTALNREYILRLQSMASVDDLVEEAGGWRGGVGAVGER